MNDKISKQEAWCKAAGWEFDQIVDEGFYATISGEYRFLDPENKDGDAFRLMVDVGMDVRLLGSYPDVFFCDNTEHPGLGEIEVGVYVSKESYDKRAATRAAICQCAEQIGRSM